MAIYLPQQPSFMDQFLGTGVMNNVMKAMMMRMENQRADAESIQGLQQQGYSEADYTAPTPQEKAAGYRGAAPGQYQGKVFDPSQQVEVAGRRFQRPPEPKMSYKAVKDETTGRLMLELYQDKKLSDVKPLALAAQGAKKAGWQQKTRKFKGKNGNPMAQDYAFNPQNPEERIPLGKPYPQHKTQGGGASIQLIGFDDKDPKGKRPVTYNPKTGKIDIGKPVKDLGDVTKKTTNVEQISRNVAKAKQRVQQNPNEEGAKSDIEYLQKYDNSDTVYVWKETPNTWFGINVGTNKGAYPQKLPVINGKQVTTLDVRNAMRIHTLSFEEALEKITSGSR